MPHKHKRKHAGIEDKNEFNLAPDKKARPLSVHKPKPEPWDGFDTSNDKPNKRRKPNKSKADELSDLSKGKDDTPKNFARLMAWQKGGKKLRRGLDDGAQTKKPKEKKRKHGDLLDAMAKSASKPKGTATSAHAASETVIEPPTASEAVAVPEASTNPAQLKIQPGERLREFAVRVDQNLPLSNVPKHSTKDKVLGLKQKLTKHSRHLQRMQTEWRNAEGKIRSRKEDEQDDLADKQEEDQLLWMDVNSANANRKGKKRRKAGAIDDADPWHSLEKKRKEAGGSSVGGLRASDAVQAPPVLKPIKNMFRDSANQRVQYRSKCESAGQEPRRLNDFPVATVVA